MLQSTIPLQARNPNGILNVLIVGRISTEHQNIQNIEASYRYVESYLQQIYDGPIQIKLLGEQASGMLTTRASIREAEDLVAAGQVDLVISEDLSRIYRNPRHQYDFVQNAVDMGTRVICIGDHLDTADENWEVMMGAATLRHGLFIPDTRRRVRRTATNSFHLGGMVGKVRFGYRKLTKDEATSGHFGPPGLRLAKREECTPIIREMKDRVLSGATYAATADWLQAEAIATGSHASGGAWSGRLVEALLRAPILSGTRTFRKSIYEPVFRTGEHRRRNNATPETKFYPELAHLMVEEQAELWRAMDMRAEALRRTDEQRRQRLNVPRSRSLWPGQAASCAICGNRMYYADSYLKCKNSRRSSATTCWNHVQAPVGLTRQRVFSWLLDFSRENPPLQEALVELAWDYWQRAHCQPDKANRDPQRDIESLERQAANLAKALAAGGPLDALVRELQTVQGALQQARERNDARRASTVNPGPVMSPEHIATHLGEVLLGLTGSSFEFADALRRMFPNFVIYPVQTLDTPLVRPRARLTFRPSLVLGPGQESNSADLRDVELVLDLFEPPVHIQYLAACLAARRDNHKLSLRKIATALKIGYMTVKRCLGYARLMDRDGLSEPYRELHERPEHAARWRQRRRVS